MSERVVLLLGRSLLLSLVAVSLTPCPRMCVVRARAWAEVSGGMAQGVPDVIIFDLHEPGEGDMLRLLLQHPGMLLIGLDTETNQAVLVSGREARSLTLSGIRDMAEGG